VRRRFEVLGEAGGVVVINDYAHHPTEIRATLETARAGWSGRIVAIFQPHLYSRTRDFAADFGEALSRADRVFVADVYPAREEPIRGVDGALVAASVRDTKAQYVPDLADLGPALVADAVAGDLVVVMGAGDVEQVAYEVYEKLKEGPAGP
jgi:UDP-N-acetylmuramate--alanine ligase